MKGTLLTVGLITTLFLVCKNASVENKDSKVVLPLDTLFEFSLKSPDRTIKLAPELKEISSAAYYNDSILLCVQDESADVFTLNLNTEMIVDRHISGMKGDYEGIEIIGKDVFLLKSNGNLLVYNNFFSNDKKVSKFKTPLNAQNDAEGLGYDLKTNSLLIACKNKSTLSESNLDSINKRCIYIFNLGTGNLQLEPFICIDLKELNTKTGIDKFMPSGLAVHPVSGYIYIISAVGNSLVVVNREGNLLFAEKLEKKIFRQPEGICFSSDGKTLFISNEGHDKNGNIQIFKAR
ncbi:MAG: SdiA-regulated domain-containing protein [Bacteroidales bacterium]